MYTRNLPVYLVRALAPPRLAAGVLVTAALLSAACSDTASRINSPLLDRSSNGSSASSFAVLANAAVSCKDSSITGDVGTFLTTPPGAITLTLGCTISGTQDIGGPAAVAAYKAYLNTYATLALPVPCTSLTGTLAGDTLPPGVYCFDAAAALTDTLTLNGPSNGTWLFKIGVLGTGALTGTDFTVRMAGGGQQCNVTWWVAEAATMTRGAFQGNLLTGAAITFTGPGTFNGNAWAGAAGVGDVTFSYTKVIGCATSNGNGGDNDKGNKDHDKEKCNQGVGNGHENCDPGHSDDHHGSNDEDGGRPGHPGRKGGH